MGTDLKPMETFMERVKGKLRDDIGGLLPDEAVAEMVQKVINDEFFTKKQIPDPSDHSSYNRRMIDAPTPFQEMVLEACKPIIEKHVGRILLENAPKIEAQIQATIENGLMSLLVSNLDKILAPAFSKVGFQIENNIAQHLRSRGLAV